MKFAYLLLAMGAVLALFVGCGGGGAGSEQSGTEATEAAASESFAPLHCPTRADQVDVTLDGRAGPENVGLLMADKRGFFRDAGVHVWLGSPANPISPVLYVAGGTDDLGVAQQPQVVIGRDEGGQLIAIGSVIPQPTVAMIWLKKSGIDAMADLKGKTIAIPGMSFQTGFLASALAEAGLTLDDVTVKRVGYELVPALLSGKADAIFGGSWNLEGAALRARGVRPVITKAKQLGIPEYEEAVVVAPFECVYKHPDMYRDFLHAVERGTKAAVNAPRGALRVIEENVESDPELGRREIEAELEATLPMLARDGRMHVGQDLVDWMYKEKMLDQEWSSSVIFTNVYH